MRTRGDSGRLRTPNLYCIHSNTLIFYHLILCIPSNVIPRCRGREARDKQGTSKGQAEDRDGQARGQAQGKQGTSKGQAQDKQRARRGQARGKLEGKEGHARGKRGKGKGQARGQAQSSKGTSKGPLILPIIAPSIQRVCGATAHTRRRRRACSAPRRRVAAIKIAARVSEWSCG
jgi:hypothetical protein